MNHAETATLTPATPRTGAPACPSCGLVLPLPRAVLAARLRCPAGECAVRLRIRAGRPMVV